MTASRISRGPIMFSNTLMRNRIVEIARRHKGAPFRHQGRTAQGLDCVGLLIIIADELGLPYHDEPNYPRVTMGTEFIRRFREGAAMRQKSLAERKAGDILIIRQRQRPCHVAIYTGENTIVHSYAARGKVFEEPFTKYWERDTVACYEYPGADK